MHHEVSVGQIVEQLVAADATTRDAVGRLLSSGRQAVERVNRLLAGESVATHSNLPLVLTVNQAARLIGASRTLVWRMEKAGRLRTVELSPRTKRFRSADVVALANAGEAA